eukprot:jgi/Chlat1/3881/Chrsp26S04169
MAVPSEKDVDDAMTDVDKRRKLRQDFKALEKRFEDAQEGRLDQSQDFADYISASIQQADQLHADVVHTRELATDIDMFCKIANSALTHYKQALQKGGTQHSPAQVITKLKERYAACEEGSQEGDIDWFTLGRDASLLFKTFTAPCTMHGPMDLLPKPKAVRQRAQRTALAEKIAPGQVTATDASNREKQTDRNMSVMVKLLKSNPDAPVVKVINNPQSFAQTVENLFTLSFLVREGHVQVRKNDAGILIVASAEPPTKAAGGKKVEMSQCVMRLDMADWKMLQAHNVGSLVPHRSGVVTDTEDQQGCILEEEHHAQQSTRKRRESGRMHSRNRLVENSQSNEEEYEEQEGSPSKRRRS